MAIGVYSVTEPEQYRKAGPTDLMELNPPPGGNRLYLPKWVLEVMVYGIVHAEFIHLSGPTGSAKSSLLEALHLVPENFNAICSGMGYKVRPVKLFAIEMATYEAPGELFQRRALKGGTTYDEKSRLVQSLHERHLRSRELPGCVFPDDAEKTWNRSFDHFAKLVNEGRL